MNRDDEGGKNHHVAWADRIGLNKLWAKDILNCSESFGTLGYEISVNRFRNDIINIKNSVQLKSIIDDYVDNTLREWKMVTLDEWNKVNPIAAQNDSWIRDTNKIIEVRSCELLCNFMIQLLEDNGFCFYESNIEEDEMQ